MDLKAWVVSSSALFFIPTVLSAFTQHIIVFVVLFMTSIFSTLYHAYDEEKFETIDTIFASFSMLLSIMLTFGLGVQYKKAKTGSTEKKILLGRLLCVVIFGVAALTVYFVGGSDLSSNDDTENEQYDILHGLWHAFLFIAGTALVAKRIDLALLNKTLKQIVHR